MAEEDCQFILRRKQRNVKCFMEVRGSMYIVLGEIWTMLGRINLNCLKMVPKKYFVKGGDLKS